MTTGFTLGPRVLFTRGVCQYGIITDYQPRHRRRVPAQGFPRIATSGKLRMSSRKPRLGDRARITDYRDDKNPTLARALWIVQTRFLSHGSVCSGSL
jgi:hypothetical protein